MGMYCSDRWQSVAMVVLCVVCSLTAIGGVSAGELVLVQQGRPQATIVISAQANDKVKLAAEELQTYIEKMSGAKLPIVTDEQNPTGPLVLVGPSRTAANMGVSIPQGLTNARREEGFVIACRGKRLLLAGNDEGPYHGTEYAVYDFLNRLGVRWFMPGEYGEYVPQKATIKVGELHVVERPDFVMRNWWGHVAPELQEQERRWKLRNKMNPELMFATPADATAINITDQSLFDTRPELFAMNPDGSRNRRLPNLSNPEAVKVAAGIIKDYFREHPEANSYGFAPDDGYPRDYDPQTVKLNQGFVELGGRPGVPGEVSTSEEWFRFVNAVTAEVRKEFPDAYIATNGYANRDIPPQGMELDDHLVIMFAAIWSCTLHSYDNPHCWQKVRQGQMLKRWCELCDNVWIYGYNYQMLVSGLTPLPEFTKLRHDFPLMKKWGVMGFYDETRNVWAECGIASRYLRARLEWDADADVDAILDDFFSKWYGKAAEAMKGFYYTLDEAIATTPVHGHEDRILLELYTPGLLRALGRYMKQAVKAAEDDTERVQLHVEAERLIWEHLKAYVAMCKAAKAGDFARAARDAERMLAIRKQLYAINPFYMWKEEAGWVSGVWYWTISDRRDFYKSLADKISGNSGELVAMLPQQAQFCIDPHDDGVFARWYDPGTKKRDWRRILTSRPFYRQGYEDEQGHPYVGYMWYRFNVKVPQKAEGRKVMLYVPLVSTEAWCWVNGQYVGHRPYKAAYERPAEMEVDVSDAIRPGETNGVVFRVSTSLAPAQAAEGIYSRPFLYSPND